VIVRAIEPSEFERLGELTVAAYHAFPDGITEASYDAELRDVATRVAAPDTEVLVAVDGATVLGGVTYVRSAASPYFELADDPDAASFRMLAVDPAVEGSGAGRALVTEVVARARAAQRRRIVIHSTPWMRRAHGLYDGFGFTRRPDLDWEPRDGIVLWGFSLEL
jgi:ribosomal protein S18 acetylase RimI-like enzyme